MSFWDDLFGTGDDQTQTTTQTVTQLDYPETTAAREEWWNKLLSWGNDSSYGAIPQDWQDIWDLASKRVNEYYSGTATTTGAMDKIKASAARRGVSDSPALQMSLARASAEQGSQLSDLAKNQAIAQAEYSEQGRQNWLSSLQSLAGLKSGNYTSTGTTTLSSGSNLGDTISGIGSILSSLYSLGSGSSWMDSIKNLLNGMPSSTGFSGWGAGVGNNSIWGMGYGG